MNKLFRNILMIMGIVNLLMFGILTFQSMGFIRADDVIIGLKGNLQALNQYHDDMSPEERQNIEANIIGSYSFALKNGSAMGDIAFIGLLVAILTCIIGLVGILKTPKLAK